MHALVNIVTILSSCQRIVSSRKLSHYRSGRRGVSGGEWWSNTSSCTQAGRCMLRHKTS